MDRPFDYGEAKRLYTEMTYEQIGRLYNLSAAAVAHRLKREAKRRGEWPFPDKAYGLRCRRRRRKKWLPDYPALEQLAATLTYREIARHYSSTESAVAQAIHNGRKAAGQKRSNYTPEKRRQAAQRRLSAQAFRAELISKCLRDFVEPNPRTNNGRLSFSQFARSSGVSVETVSQLYHGETAYIEKRTAELVTAELERLEQLAERGTSAA